MPTLTLITGGIKSGKSRYALELARSFPEIQKCFIATAEPLDQEMKLRIQRHREERGNDFWTLEEPLWLAKAFEEATVQADLVLIDCLTLWMNNLWYRFAASPEKIEEQINLFLKSLTERKSETILVTNEVGLGVIPENPLARRFMDSLGKLNQSLSAMSDEVIFMISGIAQRIKGGVREPVD